MYSGIMFIGVYFLHMNYIKSILYSLSISADLDTAFPPSFTKHPLESTTLGSLGGSLTILCHPEAAPRPNITWLHDGRVVTGEDSSSPAHLQPLTNGHLRIVNLSFSDQGIYTCKAVNELGTAESSTTLTVLGMIFMSRCMQHYETLHQNIFLKKPDVCSFLNIQYFFKRLAYTLTAYCYGSKSVMQPDASSKRYLWDKILCYRT